ncbi:MAG: hypothetical protein A2X23_13680 [Chloroflexi bacterium GWC2_73_18]|nr:MAG: hypothetical protein A2X23_13680 [Chloroflexi bacterium GWC2_73_18]
MNTWYAIEFFARERGTGLEAEAQRARVARQGRVRTADERIAAPTLASRVRLAVRRRLAALVAGALLTSAIVATTAAGGQATLSDGRVATSRFHHVSTAEAAGYGPSYVCTDEAGEGAMGQHSVNGALVADLRAEPDGGLPGDR